jgi:HK97 family phage major capsid protein
MPSAEPEVSLANVAAMIRSASEGIEARDKRIRALENSVNELLLKMGRPSGGGFDADVDERASAVGLLEQRFYNRQTKHDGAICELGFSSEEISEAMLANKAMHKLLHATSIDILRPDERKALSSFSFGSQGFLLAPEMSQQILSCLVDATDIASLMQNVSISAGSIKFMVDNEVWDVAAWACDASCFANNPTKNLGDGLGELEIKAESLRYIACATKELLEDSSVAIEPWLFDKASRAFRTQISDAIIAGDGFGKPMGVLNPAAGIPICETSENTAPGTFTWQDLVMLSLQVPMSLQDNNGTFLMNQNTLGLMLTMSDANGRPILALTPSEALPFRLNGRPVAIASQMPDCIPGATPIAYGNWNQAYMVVNRRGVTVQNDPFSAGWCNLFKFDTRIGGAVVCANAARLLRVR